MMCEKKEMWGNFAGKWNEEWNYQMLFLPNSVYICKQICQARNKKICIVPYSLGGLTKLLVGLGIGDNGVTKDVEIIDLVRNFNC